MAIYRIPYEITGYVVINAQSAEEAEAAFQRDYSMHELADIGVLEAFPAEGDEDITNRFEANFAAMFKDAPHG